MNTVKSFWVGWGSLCVAGAGAYYFAKKQINEDRATRYKKEQEKKRLMGQMEAEERAYKDLSAASSDSPSHEANVDPAPTRHAPTNSREQVIEKSKYEATALAHAAPSLALQSYCRKVQEFKSRKSTSESARPFTPQQLNSIDVLQRNLGHQIIKMASHQLAIAKAAFSAGLLRPDPVSLSRDEIAHFHSLLNDVVTQCTPQNVQKCKRWILENIVQSTARCTAFGKYLTGLSGSFSNTSTSTDSSKREPSIKRKRLHLLYLINDILFHAKYRSNDASICSKFQPILVSLFESAAVPKTGPKHLQKISDLLSIWEEKSYYSPEYIDKLREAVKNASESGPSIDAGNSAAAVDTSASKTSKSVPFVMPAMHGDPSTPWFDLPAGNLIPHIVPNSMRPINPDMVKPLQFIAGPADENLVVAVKALLDDVQTIFGPGSEGTDKISWDIDELGQRIELDEITGEGVGVGAGVTVQAGSEDTAIQTIRPEVTMAEGEGIALHTARPAHLLLIVDAGGMIAALVLGLDIGHQFRDFSERAPPNQSLPPNPPPFPQDFNPNFPPPPPPPFPPQVPMQNMPYNGTGGQYGGWPPPPPPPLPNPYQNAYFNPAASQSGVWPPPPPPPPNMPMPPYQGNPPAPGPGGWHTQPPPPPPPPLGNGGGQIQNGWNNSQYNRGGRGNYRG
ncbi:hypothetical protein B7463_g4805, partial [Scytalidium lignicola]